MQTPSHLPLRWESSGDQWWFASPIDWAAANGHYDLVRQLLRLDTNHLLKLTSLRRTRRLETVWDDAGPHSDDVAKRRCQVARNLLLECETKKGHNSLLRAGYGGWLLYTAASAGDVAFVRELLAWNPRLVFGEGEYGVTDILYAAGRSKSARVFGLLFDSSVSLLEGENGHVSDEGLKMEMVNRAVHAAARGGNVEVLRELLLNCSDVLVYRDSVGSTLLHSAAGTGQVEVVKMLLATYEISNSRDDQGNTALHVAAYRGHLPIVEALISSSPSLVPLANNHGDTFLHMAVFGFRTPSFRRLDRRMEMMNQLARGWAVESVINARNHEGKTALHVAVSENVHANVVELLMSVFSVGLNVVDGDGCTPLDLLKRRPRSRSSDALIKRFVSAGGTSDDRNRTGGFDSRVRMQGTVGSPGTSFRLRDPEIFLRAGMKKGHFGNLDLSSSGSSETSPNSARKKKLKFLMEWQRKSEKESEEGGPHESRTPRRSRSQENPGVSLRERFTRMPSPPSPCTKKKLEVQSRQGGILNELLGNGEKTKVDVGCKGNSFNKKVMNQVFCLGAEGISVYNPGRFKPQLVQCCKQAVAT
ncbi:unnamed protein product [Cuscuta campestris]|uniref:Uncharacterized protein n=1 Tax=Cuscuta campestris TaxID=132261 RepID=A0A484L0A1_9ASTE|nr:unnamed protein product [Cuscuta campestris]